MEQRALQYGVSYCRVTSCCGNKTQCVIRLALTRGIRKTEVLICFGVNLMNKMDYINKLAKKTNLPRTTALRITNAMLDIFQKELNEKERIQFIGFGSFEVRNAPERMARNPRTKEHVLIPARYKVVFRPSEKLLNKLNGSNLFIE